MTTGGGFEGWMYFGDGGWRMEDGGGVQVWGTEEFSEEVRRWL
jgi:hypothetical protein